MRSFKLFSRSRFHSFLSKRKGAAFGKLTGNQKMLFLLPLSLSLCLHAQSIHSIEDESIREARKFIDSEIEKKRNEFPNKKSEFPNIQMDFAEGNYVISFEIPKSQVYQSLVAFVYTAQIKESSTGFSIRDVKTSVKNGVYELSLKFQEFEGDRKRHLLANGEIVLKWKSGESSVEFRFSKSMKFESEDLNAFLKAYFEVFSLKEAELQVQENTIPKSHLTHTSPFTDKSTKSSEEALDSLRNLGTSVFLPNDNSQQDLDWDCLAGYESQKREIEDTILLALVFPQIYDEIATSTRMKKETNRPRAILFEGPPGTGKTTSAKIIAHQVNIPLVYMPIESIMSKFYGESEKRFAEVFESAQTLGKAIIFIDEIDAIAGTRDGDTHEVSKRILSTLLRKIDSFESNNEVILICATNRKGDLDPAMLSRIDLAVKFDLPNETSRIEIFKRYAKQLNEEELRALATASSGFSGRDISDLCKDTERKWASKMIRKEVNGSVPDLSSYLNSLWKRKESLEIK